MAARETPEARPRAADCHEIDFRAGGLGHEYLLDGWSYPEKDYTWTLGQTSLVQFPAVFPAADLALELVCAPLVHDGAVRFQRLFVEVNGVVVGKLVVRTQSRFEFFIARETVGDGSAIDVAFRIPDACSPEMIGLSGDMRHLGFRMISLRLQPLGVAAKAGTGAGGLSDREILMDIQSLGTNCELGFIQRSVGAEPLGLFRWASTPLPNLLRALEVRFDGLGDPRNIVVEVDGATEFQIVDRKFGFRNHSFAFEKNGARREAILKREQARLPFLVRLMVENLDQASKLFCFHDAGRSGREEIDRLVAALRRFGPNVLLWICPAANGAQVGTAETVYDGLIKGYVDRFEPVHDVKTPSREAWLRTIRAGHGLWVDGRGSGIAGPGSGRV